MTEPRADYQIEGTSNLEAQFLWLWRNLGDGSEPEREWRFHPVRRWRFDFAFPDARVAIECEGGTWSRSRHVRGKGYAQDCLKYSAAAAMGWAVLRFTGTMMTRQPDECVALVKQALALKGNNRGE